MKDYCGFDQNWIGDLLELRFIFERREESGQIDINKERRKSRAASKFSGISIDQLLNNDDNEAERGASSDKRIMDPSKFLEKHIIDNLLKYK